MSDKQDRISPRTPEDIERKYRLGKTLEKLSSMNKADKWIPLLDTDAISSYTTQYGWYMKMNQTVTVGFYIKASCNSGYNSTAISISGLPFTPMCSAAGGGMCSGAYISEGNNFQCFVAETSGLITTRVQSLGTLSEGCRYPLDDGELTLSGTITFMSTA